MKESRPNSPARRTRTPAAWTVALALAAISTASATLVRRAENVDSRKESSRAAASKVAAAPRARLAPAPRRAATEASSDAAAVVSTDQTDYRPGETVVITGSG